jgi:N-acyl-D-amino-acid deacylase
MHDLLIKNARIHDGSGNPWSHGEVAVTGDRIEAVGKLGSPSAKRVIDAEGQALAPGFIDIHSHSDVSILEHPGAESKIRQGVTTEVIGQCGSSAAPLVGRGHEGMDSDLAGSFELTWGSMADYMAAVDRRHPALNIAPVIGHGAIRRCAMGYDRRQATADELATMERLVAESMEAGAFGMTTGLIYPPSSYADTPEIIALAKVVARYDGIYMSHIRDASDGLLDAIAEAIEIGRQAKLPVQISHHKACAPWNWGRVVDSFVMMEDARREGIDVTADQYPYLATSTGLATVVPQWAHEGGAEKMVARLMDPETRAKIRAEAAPFEEKRGWQNIVIANIASNKEFEGKNMAEIAAIMGKEPVDAAFDLLIANHGSIQMVRFAMCEEDVATVMRWPATMIGSDASAIDPACGGVPHPRTYGTFPRVLGRYVRELKVLRLEDAIHRMTGLSAWRMGIHDRGLIRPGYKADLVLFDPDTIADQATYTEPHQYPVGIKVVVVNGQVTVENGQQYSTRAGVCLRKAR